MSLPSNEAIISKNGLTRGYATFAMSGSNPFTVKQAVHDGDTVKAQLLGNFSIRFLGVDRSIKPPHKDLGRAYKLAQHSPSLFKRLLKRTSSQRRRIPNLRFLVYVYNSLANLSAIDDYVFCPKTAKLIYVFDRSIDRKKNW